MKLNLVLSEFPRTLIAVYFKVHFNHFLYHLNILGQKISEV
jgi:hypothetical protein